MLEDVRCPTSASSHYLVDALCSMPNLTHLELSGKEFEEELYSSLNAKASTLQVQSVMLKDVGCPTSPSLHHLADALCSMPNLTDLRLGGKEFKEEFYSTLNAKASTLQGCFPQIRKGNFRFNGVAQDDLDSFLHAFTVLQSQVSTDTTDDGNQVHWDFLTDIPQELTLQDDEAVISCGIRFSPSGTKLSKPIKVTLDHNAHFSDPRRAEIVFYTREKDSESFVRIPASTGHYPRCDVRAKDLDLYVDHFCVKWIVAKYSWYFIGKRVNCLPYVRPPVRRELPHFVQLCIYDDLFRVIQKIEKEMTANKMIFPSQPMFVEWKHGDIDIKLFEGPKENEKKIDEQTLGTKKMNRVDRRHFFFELKPLESEASPEILKFSLNQRKSRSEDLSDPTLIQFILPYGDMGTTTTTATTTTAATFPPMHASSQSAAAATFPSMHAGSQAAGVSTLSPTDLESDGILDTLSKNMPHETYITLCRHLGLGYNEAYSILVRFNTDYQRATRHCLAQWKTRTGDNMDELKTILVAAGAKNLVKYVN